MSLRQTIRLLTDLRERAQTEQDPEKLDAIERATEKLEVQLERR